jgi:hypothetical protein
MHHMDTLSASDRVFIRQKNENGTGVSVRAIETLWKSLDTPKEKTSDVEARNQKLRAHRLG